MLDASQSVETKSTWGSAYEYAQKLPIKEIAKTTAYMGCALALLAGAGILLYMGSHALTPINYAFQHYRHFHEATLLMGTSQTHMMAMLYLGLGGAAAGIGLYMIGRYFMNLAKKNDRIKEIDQKLDACALFRLGKLAAVFAAFVGGAVLLGLGAYYISHAGPACYEITYRVEKFIGYHIWGTGACLSIAGIASGSALATMATLLIARQFLRQQNVQNIQIFRNQEAPL